MLDSIDYPVRQLLIIDNGQKLGGNLTHENRYVRSVNVLSLPSNLGVAGSWNLGIKCLPHNNRWYFSSVDVTYGKGALETMSQALPTDITLNAHPPHWQTFVIGEAVVQKIGLFDEAYHPIYFEDNDYARRASEANVPIRFYEAPVSHENSSTINSDSQLRRENDRTFSENRKLFRDKQNRNDYSVHGWNLSRRRQLSWD
jgi:GT2 family glycosyltransferase